MMEELRPAITATAILTLEGRTKQVEVELRAALTAWRCDACSRFFSMRIRRGEYPIPNGRWDGRMSGCPGPLGNTLSLICCSMKCAAALEEGAWKKSQGHPLNTQIAAQYVDAGYGLVFCEFKSGFPIFEEELVAKWEDSPFRTLNDFIVR